MLVLEHILPCFGFILHSEWLKEFLEIAVSANIIVMDSKKAWFEFAHDRIQDAAYGITST